uniref:Uncharacterized protein n=1 Tax=Hymenopteran tombus-related virus TaxID=2822555 RepID=A0A8A6RT05_9TOMB|nr:hypothetical protein [Hymenopteran tombus-related virus]
MGFGAATIALIGAYTISKVCSSLKPGITIPKTMSPRLPHINIVTDQLPSPTTILNKSQNVTVTSSDLSATLDRSLDNSTSSELLIQLNVRCINGLLKILSRARYIAVEYSHSLK